MGQLRRIETIGSSVEDVDSMPHQKSPGWQISVTQAGGAIMTAAVTASLALLVWVRLLSRLDSPSLAFALLFLTFVGLCVALYTLWY